MSSPTIKQLEAFYWAATCDNFAIAAQRLHISVSSLSQRIHELECILDHQLFDRRGHRAVLTEDGEHLLSMASNVLEAVITLQATFTNQQKGLNGRLKFGVGELSALTWLPKFIAIAQKQYPLLHLEPYVDVGAVLEQKLDAGELDFAIMAGRSSKSSILSQSITKADFVWMIADSLLDQDSPQNLISLLTRHTLVTLPAGAGTTRILDDWLLSQNIHEIKRITCNNWSAVAGMIREGVGIGFLPKGWMENSAGSTLIQLESNPPLPSLYYAFQWRRGDIRNIIPTMQILVSEHINFSLRPNNIL
ncbi:LysR family transcriptional regulator [Acinetobacter baumannii]|uniref:LysR family transcriptional regulator n=1 Tax=Acinetobacter baumannii TaxID=470 RepID=UPI000451B8D1|nr:LysR family transcriptional regulator [Acinetobacter baumannii]EXI39918.1 bacterial regulatory helix-turn-helix, lysR family protein [Acinetobacter baumannii 846928]EXR45059.1 bacterial regulatory helix-turn-helix, lysR family protein [Acinetobacter baumannii 1391434]MDC4268109.1 LysR family transcriptional regulator [Acinetobacter baumannii]MDC4339866.1 LysR family transcriptional regulator [Acinetobacter baumannii]MDC4422636.1 LysR family transcriptional regulator [Acinetobacter baumannii